MEKIFGQGRLDGKEYTILHLDPDKITVLPQERKTFDHSTIEDLGESIRANGQINEGLINHINNTYVLIAGERRLRAIKYLNSQVKKTSEKRFINCKVFESLSVAEAFQLQVAENSHENVPPEQEAEALYSLWLIKMHTPELEEMSLRKFCRLIGKSETSVRKAFLFVRDLHPLIRKEVHGPTIKKEKNKRK